VLLVFGRRLFWFFVAAIGFVLGLMLAREALDVRSDLLAVAIAILAGVIGALLSVLLQKLAVALAGAAAGAYLGLMFLRALGGEQFAWAGMLVGGILGGLLLLVVFEWALIVISSLVGATLVASALRDESAVLLGFVLSFAAGVVAQALQLPQVRRREAEKRARPRHHGNE
jgi:hypothetical protein